MQFGWFAAVARHVRKGARAAHSIAAPRAIDLTGTVPVPTPVCDRDDSWAWDHPIADDRRSEDDTLPGVPAVGRTRASIQRHRRRRRPIGQRAAPLVTTAIAIALAGALTVFVIRAGTGTPGTHRVPRGGSPAALPAVTDLTRSTTASPVTTTTVPAPAAPATPTKSSRPQPSSSPPPPSQSSGPLDLLPLGH